MRWSVIFEPATLALYAEGVVTTATLLLSSLAVGGLMALVFALALTSPIAPLRWLVGAYTYVIRGTPLLIQVYLIYYGIAQLEWVQLRWNDVWPWTHFKEPFFCALLAFSLNTAAYTAEMLAGAIRDTHAGEVEAAQAMGMSRWQTMRRVIMPSAMRRTLPAYSNEVVMMLHSTSLASTVPAMLDITAAASRIYSDYYLPFEAYLFAAAIYLLITFALVGLFRLTERRFLAHLAPRSH
ncbi:ABC transporter permease [Hydrogenophaga sp.]|uniref:ABC transporter permease n=1 Tax=Hydrogenophaga sp. TaxID=1904254 RepID=UPI00271A5BF8|nr:ABC transporter permease [Hydrogenophaga sp.]MDO8906087.1 ABC transporter permease [Hydrogenophaga sp.]